MPTSTHPFSLNPSQPLNQTHLLSQLLDIVIALSTEKNTAKLYEKIVHAAQEITSADGASLYLVNNTITPTHLDFAIVRNRSLRLALGGPNQEPVPFAPIPLFLESGAKNLANVSTYTYHHKKPLTIADAYTALQFDFSGTQRFDQQTGYRSQSMLTLPLINHANEVIGVLQLINAQNPQQQTIAFDPNLEPIALALASSAAITLDNQLLIQSHKALLDAFIQAIAKAIDAKSPHTSAHCERVPAITELLAQAACNTTTGPLKHFDLNEDEWYELRVAAWLHDCGKLSTPDHILDKSTKLHLLTDQIEAIQARFAAHIAQLELQLAQSTTASAKQQLQQQINQRRADCAFLVEANKGGEFMSEAHQDRIRGIGQLTWVDVNQTTQPLLSEFEINMLCIARGTLSAEERQLINQHIEVTIDILEHLPFPKHLARVPEYAGGHHEKVDGTGYPKGLRGDQMSWPARMMAIADVFEALTARDRPYKDPMKLSQALGILKNMALNGHIDPDLYTIFIKEKVWQHYAQTYLLPEQIDISQADAFLIST